jgi:hypothetical protein
MPRWNLITGAAMLFWLGGPGLTTFCASAHALEPQKTPHQENRAQLLVDLVFGLRPSERYAAVAAPLTAGAVQPSRGYVALGATQSLMFAGTYAILDTLRVGARAAVTLASAALPNDAVGVGLAALSNTELEAEHHVRLAANTEAALGLGLILPTALGHEHEDTTLATQDNLHSDLSEAAAAARGFEDGALFRAERVGLIPKVHVAHHNAKLRLESHVKLENLLSVRSAPHHRYLGELVVGGFYGYDLFEPLTLGIRVWSNILLEKTDETNLVCEPQVQIHGAHVQALIGALIPLVQRANAPTGSLALRLAAAALF